MKKTFLLLTVSTIFLSGFFLSPLSALAVCPPGVNPPPTGCDDKTGTTPPAPQTISLHLDNPFNGGDTIPAFFESIIKNVLLPIGAVIAVIFFILSGFKYVTARGNETKIAEATRSLLYTAIGTAVLLGAWALVTVISGTISQLQT